MMKYIRCDGWKIFTTKGERKRNIKIGNKWIMNEILNFWGRQFYHSMRANLLDFYYRLPACGEIFCFISSLHRHISFSYSLSHSFILLSTKWTWYCVWRKWKLFCRMKWEGNFFIYFFFFAEKKCEEKQKHLVAIEFFLCLS